MIGSICLALSVLACFVLMSETRRKGGWVRRFKFIYLGTLTAFPLAYMISATYMCMVLRFIGLTAAFVIISQIPCQHLSRLKQVCAVLVYGGVLLQLISLIKEEIMILIN